MAVFRCLSTLHCLEYGFVVRSGLDVGASLLGHGIGLALPNRLELALILRIKLVPRWNPVQQYKGGSDIGASLLGHGIELALPNCLELALVQRIKLVPQSTPVKL